MMESPALLRCNLNWLIYVPRVCSRVVNLLESLGPEEIVCNFFFYNKPATFYNCNKVRERVI